MSLEELKLFLKVDYTEDDELISGLQSAAEEYLTNAGVIKDYEKSLYVLAVKLLVGHWYEKRSPVGEVGESAFSLRTMILQLKYT